MTDHECLNTKSLLLMLLNVLLLFDLLQLLNDVLHKAQTFEQAILAAQFSALWFIFQLQKNGKFFAIHVLALLEEQQVQVFSSGDKVSLN